MIKNSEHKYKTCNIDGCKSLCIEGRDICTKHRWQLMKKGEILTKSKYDENPIRVEGELAYLDIYSYSNELPKLEHTVIFDSEDVGKVKGYHWIYSKRWKSVYRKRHNPSQLMKVLIDYNSEELTAIPINKDPFDCRKENIHLVDLSERQHMTGLSRRNTSGYRGISWEKGRNKWKVQLRAKEKLYTYRTECLEDAIEKRISLEIEHLGKQFTKRDNP